ncbi:PREDICTED: putative RNA polymerase II subunit B1 CTD phosphatase RPAP2 [Chrysochloris asiatica]|uniref:RNA polymerase II subunit B1 CTD phosphatase RPAP2 homolog n=1 Tax=Chrysochloris asiatica TaxID=185453 RepID=A0A9B0SUY3_CHRAS|nr:PREDICTED: putative RNA polymerase II subunit B1 CTD phosphatase RPAP2 [Chrysochloris asiatica]
MADWAEQLLPGRKARAPGPSRKATGCPREESLPRLRETPELHFLALEPSGQDLPDPDPFAQVCQAFPQRALAPGSEVGKYPGRRRLAVLSLSGTRPGVAYKSCAGTKQTSASKQDISKRKAELEAAVRKKIEFERKALCIVEQLLEENITEEFLVECGKFITSAHYSDVVDERSISKLCGYPLCQKQLGIVPKQKYKISTKTNKVYDITERKSFCSNFCYKASKFFQAQIPKTPVWIRGEEERHPDFQLLKEGQSGHSGEEVQLCGQAIKMSDIDNPGHSEKQSGSSSSSIHSDSSSDNEQDFVSSILPGNNPKTMGIMSEMHKSSITKKKFGNKFNSKLKDKEQAIVDVAEQLDNCRLDSQDKAANVLPLQNVNTQISSNSPVQEKLQTSENSENRYSSSEITLVGISKKSAEHFKRKFAKSNQVSRSPSSSVQVCFEFAKTNLLKVLKETLIEWKTEETLRFLYGQNYASVCLKPPSAPLTEAEELDEDDLNPESDNNSFSLRESQNSLDEALPFRGSDTAIKPLPNYENLKKETETLNLRIREFYRGQYVLNEESTKSQDSEKHDPTFPLIDSSSQNQIRKRIVLEKLSKILPGLLGPLQITLGDIYTQLKNLVRTFRLTNKNIIHKPAEWTLIAVVLLSLLTPILGIQKHSQENVVFTQFIATLLEELHLKNEDLESLTIIFRTSCH